MSKHFKFCKVLKNMNFTKWFLPIGLYSNLHLELSSKPENISLVEPFVKKVKTYYDIEEDLYFNILLVLTEAVNNSILHGNQSNPNKQVCIDCKIKSKSKVLYFTVTDEGIGFDHTSLPDPTTPERRMCPNGRGVFLMRELSDKINYSDNGRKVEIHFKRN